MIPYLSFFDPSFFPSWGTICMHREGIFRLATLVPKMAKDIEDFQAPPGYKNFNLKRHGRIKWGLQQFGVFLGVGSSLLVALYGKKYLFLGFLDSFPYSLFAVSIKLLSPPLLLSFG